MVHTRLGAVPEVVTRYSHYLDYAVYAALAVAVTMLVVRRVRRGRLTADAPAHDFDDLRR